jgi:hypothetical protein
MAPLTFRAPARTWTSASPARSPTPPGRRARSSGVRARVAPGVDFTNQFRQEFTDKTLDGHL